MSVKRNIMTSTSKDENVGRVLPSKKDTLQSKSNLAQTSTEHDKFISSVYARIQSVGSNRFVTSPMSVNKTGAYVQISRKKA